MGNEPTTPPRTRQGSALAVDLRRARSALKRSEEAAQAAQPAERGPPKPTIICGDSEPIDCLREWFASEEWEPFPFQEEVWRAYLAGESGLIHAATGTGKTYAALMGPVLGWLADYPTGGPARRPGAPLTLLWVTPLRALAGDTEAA